MRQRARRLIGLVGAVVLGTGMGLGPAAAAADVALTVEAHPATVAAGGQVRFVAAFLLPPETVTVTSLASTRLGDVADPANPALVSTTCALPAVVGPDDDFGAYDFGCDYRAALAAPVGSWADTLTAVVRRADGTQVSVSDAVEVVVTLELGALVGTVTDDVTGAPLGQVPVAVEGAGASRTASTDASGGYGVYDLPPGQYRVSAGNLAFPEHSDYALEWYRDQDSRATADLVPVAAAGTATVDLALALGGRITGRVTDAGTGAPLADVDVSYQGGSFPGPGYVGGFRTGPDGTYAIGGLSRGTYRVCARPGTGHEPRCVAGALVVLRETTTGVDLALPLAATPSPTPTPSATGAPSPAPELVDTGAPGSAAGLLVVGGAAVAAGVLLVLAATRRGAASA